MENEKRPTSSDGRSQPMSILTFLKVRKLHIGYDVPGQRLNLSQWKRRTLQWGGREVCSTICIPSDTLSADEFKVAGYLQKASCYFKCYLVDESIFPGFMEDVVHLESYDNFKSFKVKYPLLNPPFLSTLFIHVVIVLQLFQVV